MDWGGGVVHCVSIAVKSTHRDAQGWRRCPTHPLHLLPPSLMSFLASLRTKTNPIKRTEGGERERESVSHLHSQKVPLRALMIINNYEGKLSLVQKSIHLFRALQMMRGLLGDGFLRRTLFYGAVGCKPKQIHSFIHSYPPDIFRTSYGVFPGVIDSVARFFLSFIFNL